MTNFPSRVRPLINNPVGVPEGRKLSLSYTDATIGTVQALGLPDLWPTLNHGLQEHAQGKGDTLMRLADFHHGRSNDT